MPDGAEAVLSRAAFVSLLESIRQQGYDLVAPICHSNVVTLAPVDGNNEFGAGWRDTQAPGLYRLAPHPDKALLCCGNGPRSPKEFLRSATLKLLESQATPDGLEFSDSRGSNHRPIAFVGLHGCDLQALQRLTEVLAGQQYRDIEFCERLKGLLILAVECTQPGRTCFCTSVGGNPRPTTGYDLLLTELTADEHRFLVTVGTPAGRALLARVSHTSPTADDLETARRIRVAAVDHITRRVDSTAVRQALLAAVDDERWTRIAGRCFACGNCTQVCPTCFCFTVEDTSDLVGAHCERWRKLDTCFNSAFSYIHGGSVRSTVAARYRHWVMHKFVYWVDQFGSVGCTGCGRCITWCPAAIDLTEELEAICARSRR